MMNRNKKSCRSANSENGSRNLMRSVEMGTFFSKTKEKNLKWDKLFCNDQHAQHQTQ